MWREFLESGDSKVISKLGITPFEYVVSVASVRPDGLYRALVEFVDQALGKLLFYNYLISLENWIELKSKCKNTITVNDIIRHYE